MLAEGFGQRIVAIGCRGNVFESRHSDQNLAVTHLSLLMGLYFQVPLCLWLFSYVIQSLGRLLLS